MTLDEADGIASRVKDWIDDSSLVVKVDPAVAIEAIRVPGLQPPALSLLAEYVGLTGETAKVVDVLLPLLQHPCSLVREGAILGLGFHRNGRVKWRIRMMADSDVSDGVRATARTFLGLYGVM